MSFEQTQLDELKSYYPKIASTKDGEVEFILIEDLQLPDGCEPKVVKALLCPSSRDGYSSRLFLSAQINHKGPGQNWNAKGVSIANQNWWAVSWQTNQTGLSLLGMVTAHLQAFVCKPS